MRKIETILGISNRKEFNTVNSLCMFLKMEKAKIGMCINSEIRNCEK